VGGGSLERRPLTVEEGLDRVAAVFDAMKPINDRHGRRCPTAYARGVEGPPVPTDDAEGRRLGAPGGHALRRARGQQGKHLLMLQIDQEGPVAWPAPPGPRIDPKHLGSGGGGPWGRP